MNIPNTFTITTQTFYDSYNQRYQNILITNIEPQGPLRRLIRRVKFPREFSCENQQCGLAIQNLPKYNLRCNKYSACDLMTPNEIPDLVSFLLSNGYQIDTQITNMLNQSEVKLTNQKLVFTVSYYNSSNQPNIVYMR